jgi:serine/threonine-protein kinase
MDSSLPSRWHQVSRLLDEALPLAPEERAAYLDAACAGDAALRAEVEQLLGYGARTDGFLEEPAANFAAPLLAEPDGEEDAPMPERGLIGPYRLVREIGRGGMGTIYLAEREGEFKKLVALKLVRTGLRQDRLVVRRFLEERQILASLDHPNIARLLDGGVTPEGLPWFAMEYVDGVPIDRYAQDRALPLEARLALFLHVCDAVQYAHRNLVVHRDLKPSNIMVCDDGRPILLDFGIARILDHVDGGETTLTSAGVRVLTPEYASPEQLRGDPPTTATDVYSLGVLLYELLTGQRLYRLAGRRPHEVERAILEEGPPRPSSVADPRLRRRLRGDLDTIALTAMRKEPDRRYLTVDRLADDLRRHLAGLPVAARPDSLRYRGAKFVRRNRLGVAAVAAVILSLSGGLAATRWQMRAVSREAARARAVEEFVLGLFQVSDPGISLGRAITARELLDQGAARIDSAFASQPAVQAEMLGMIGGIYRKLGLVEPATPLLERSLALHRSIYGASHPAVATSLNQLGGLLADRSRFAAAESLFHLALAIRRAHLDDNAPAVLELLANLAVMRERQNDYPAADSLLRRVLAGQREALGSEHPDVANTLSHLGVVARGMNHFPEAESAHREALALRRALYGEVHPTVGESLRNLALVLHNVGRYPEAERLYREALEVQRAVFGPKHREIAPTLNSLAVLLNTMGNDTAAESFFREALAMQREQLGPDHREIANTLYNLAALLNDRGDPAGAQPLFEEALAMRRRLFGGDHPLIATGLNGVATALREQGRNSEAEPLLLDALAIYRARLGPEHHYVGIALQNLATTRLGLADYAAADSLYRQALAIYRGVLSPTHPDIAHPLLGLGRTLRARGAHGEAEPLLREALALRKGGLPLGNWRVAEAEQALAKCLAAQGRTDEAAQLLRDGARALEGAASRRSAIERGAMLTQLIDLYEGAGRRAEAAPYRAALRAMGAS